MKVTPDDYGRRCQFDHFCKLVLYHEAVDYFRERKCQRGWETSFETLPLSDHGDRDGGSKCVTTGSICVPKNIMILKSLKVQEKSFQAFLCLLECSRVGKRTKVCKLEPPGTLIKSAYLSPMVPRGCSPLDRYSCSSGKLGNASSSFSCPSILIPPSD